ncbi:beta-propeller fold lactonase family protein [Streptomyces sp. HUAS TT3]|uniref:lactonase family protein n=1 Tax=Streptomyces sp. HUAS TT3 TaxID=3447510 RepID=UPI003F660030
MDGSASTTDRGAGLRAYIGSFTAGGGRGITVAAVDRATGTLTPLAAVNSVDNPSCLALAHDGQVLYAVSDCDDGLAVAYRPTASGLALLGRPVPVGGRGPTHLSVSGNRLLTAHYASGSVSSLPLAADGSLAHPASVLSHQGSGPDTDRQRGPHAHQVLPDPSGRWVLSVDLGTDSVRVCSLDPETGALHVRTETALRAGSGPRHLVFHPHGPVAYVVHELMPQLTVCRWDAAAGLLTPVGEVPLCSRTAPAEREYPSVGAVSGDGRFLWVAVRGSNLIATLSLLDGAGRPRLTEATGCGGSWPRDLVVDPSGGRLYVSNEWSGDVTWFDADPLTGRLRHAGRTEVPAAACLVLA